MSDDIQTRAFDGQPAFHSWSGLRLGNAPGWDGPPDPPADACSECGALPERLTGHRPFHVLDCPNRKGR
jgi:hypothetical protein